MTTDLLDRVGSRVRLLALLIVAALVGGAFVAADQHSGRPSRALGIHGLQLAAFTGNTKIYLRLPGISGPASHLHSNDLDLTNVSWGLTDPVDPSMGLPTAVTW
jgi:hypothetical protein